MGSPRNSIIRALGKYGSNVALFYKPLANASLDGDWPDPDAPPTLPAPPPRTVKAVVAPEQDNEDLMGVREKVQAVFAPNVDLNNVEKVVWQGNDYRIHFGDTYELADVKLAQVVTLMRIRAVVEQPSG